MNILIYKERVVLTCDAQLLAVWCSYTILLAILMQFLWFMQFVEHIYSQITLKWYQILFFRRKTNHFIKD